MKKIFMWLDKSSTFDGTVRTCNGSTFQFARISSSGEVSLKLDAQVGEKKQMAELNATMTVVDKGNSQTGAGYVLEVLIEQPNTNNPRKAKLTVTTTGWEAGTFVLVEEKATAGKGGGRKRSAAGVGCV